MKRKFAILAATLAIIIPSAALAVTFKGGVTFRSSLNINGSFSKGSGSFVIDHPLDPAHKLLAHSFVESPDVKNLYDGIATLDESGEAVVALPDYFEALNKDYRYQFFALDEAMPGLYLKEEVKDNRFSIAGGAPGGRVSWQVTGTRQDRFILDNPIIVEVPKTAETREVIGSDCVYEPLCEE